MNDAVGNCATVFCITLWKLGIPEQVHLVPSSSLAAHLLCFPFAGLFFCTLFLVLNIFFY